MSNSRRSKQNTRAQVLIALGLFLLVLLIFYWLQGNRHTDGVDEAGNVQLNENSQRHDGDARLSKESKKKAVKRDKTAPKLNSIFSTGVSTESQSSVDALRLPNSKVMQADAIYREGLVAYLNKDYQLANKRWQRAAKLEHAKAYFNLGLLASNTDIANQVGGLKEAKYYFSKAKKYNYIPAKAILTDGKVFNDKSIAQEAATEQGSDRSDTGSEIEETVAKVTEPPVNKAASEVGGESWVASQSDKRWTIQVRAFREKSELDIFLDEYEFGTNAAYFREPSSQGVLYKLVIGSYDSRAEASSARDSLPSEVLIEGPWLRRFADIKKTMIGS